MKISLIAAIAEENVIGKDNDLLWRLPSDMKYFKQKTLNHHILMGRLTYDSIPTKFKPLPDRTNLIITRKKNYDAPGCLIFNSINDAIKFAEEKEENELFVIGGGSIYKHTIEHADRLYITKVHAQLKGDTFFPEINLSDWSEVYKEDHQADDRHKFDYSFIIYERKTKD